MNSGYSTTPRIQRLKLFCLKVLNIVSHVDNFQRLSLPTSWTGLLPNVKRSPCQKVVIWKFWQFTGNQTMQSVSDYFWKWGFPLQHIQCHGRHLRRSPPAPWAPLAPLAISTCCSRVTAYPRRPSLALPISYKTAPNSVKFRPYCRITTTCGHARIQTLSKWTTC